MERIMKERTKNTAGAFSRRDFIRTSAAFGMASVLTGSAKLFAAGSDTIRVGLIGCGSRGMAAAQNCVQSSANIEITALGDLFQDQLDQALHTLRTNTEDIHWSSNKPWGQANQVKVTPETCFVGFDAYKKVIASDVDLVILTTPPGFRPIHLKAAIEAGKHVFMEKPVAVDVPGVRSVIESSELASKNGLGIVVGTQRHHQMHYIDIMKRVHDGQIGDIKAAQCYWIQGRSKWHFRPRQEEWSDMEWQCRVWPYFTWLSGDHIVEQHMHNIDVIHWALQANPINAVGVGGRQQRTGPEFGNIYDHFAIEFEYPGGIRVTSMSSQMDGTIKKVSERIIGTKGDAYTEEVLGRIEGANAYEYKGSDPSPYVKEHADLIASIREGEPLNEGKFAAESNMAAILGRTAAYTGSSVKWEWMMQRSQLDLAPANYELGPLPVAEVAIPGKTKLA
jgi:predicted dehydrogenase